MSPTPPESDAVVVAALWAALNDAITADMYAVMGLKYFSEFLRSLPVVPQNPDPTVFITHTDPDVSPYARQKKSVALERIAVHGAVEVQLRKQWVVYVYALWEEQFRTRLAAARGCTTPEIQSPVFGDLRHLRNDIVHHGGIATARNTGKCKLLAHWFRPGDQIFLRGKHIAEVVEALRREFPPGPLELET